MSRCHRRHLASETPTRCAHVTSTARSGWHGGKVNTICIAEPSHVYVAVICRVAAEPRTRKLSSPSAPTAAPIAPTSRRRRRGEQCASVNLRSAADAARPGSPCATQWRTTAGNRSSSSR